MRGAEGRRRPSRRAPRPTGARRRRPVAEPLLKKLPPVRRFRAHNDVTRNAVVVARVTRAAAHRGRFPPPLPLPARRASLAGRRSRGRVPSAFPAPRARRPTCCLWSGNASKGLSMTKERGVPQDARHLAVRHTASELSLTASRRSSDARRETETRDAHRKAKLTQERRDRAFARRANLPRRRGSQTSMRAKS